MLVGGMYPARGRYGHKLVGKVHKYVNVLPVREGIAILVGTINKAVLKCTHYCNLQDVLSVDAMYYIRTSAH